MKNKTYFSRQHIFRWLLLMWLVVPWALQAQTSTHITSNAQVGCKEIRGGKEEEFENGVGSEQIDSSNCVRVCAGSLITYTVNGQNISNVQWSASGGTVGTVSGAGNIEAQIMWGSTAGNASVEAVITYANGTIENQTVCIEKINSPIAEFKMLNLDRSVCKNTAIYFDNTSYQNGGTDIVSYFWDFGDGTTSTAFEPSHAFTQSGGYVVSLTVTNKCGCSNTYSLDVEVLESNPVQINCASVVCEGSREKYNVQDGCKEGEWNVIGGTIIANNGNEIEVLWDQVDPADGFGYVMYRSKCGCREWTTIKIPVILSSGQIQGQSVVCANRQNKYSLPQWPTTNFQWNMSGPSGGQLDYNQQRNEVLFKASQPGTYTLWCSYLNTLLKCEGYASMTITVEEPVVVSGGANEICEGTSQTFTATPTVPVIWNVASGGSVIYTSSPTSSPFTYPFATAGSYVVTAIKQGGGCESEGRIVKVIPTPAAPTGTISGDVLVCAGKPYVYTLSPTDAGTIPVWSVTNGVIQGSNTGNSITVVFNASATNYTVSVQNRSMDGVGCLSAPKNYSVQKIDLNTISIQSPSANNTFCPSSSATFTANLNGIVPDVMEWYFDSPNFGSFVSGQGTASVVVNFNEISSTAITNLVLKITKCGTTEFISIPVTLQTLPVISMIGGDICEGASTIDVVVTLPTNVTSGQLTFTFPNTSTEQATVTSGGTQTFTINNHFSNNSGSVISQSLQLTLNSPNGCNYVATTAVNFNIIPKLAITITPGYYYSVCPSNSYSIPLTAQIPSGVSGTYQWYHNGAAIPGATSPSYTINNASQPSPGGSYYVVVTSGGCKSSSQNIMVVASCGSFPPCTITPAPNLVVSANWIDCNTITASATFVGSPSAFEWIGSPGLQLQPGSTATSATFSVTGAGVHNVALSLNYSGCTAYDDVDVTKNYKPDFNAAITCNSNGTYNVTLTDNSLLSGITSSQIAYSYTMNGGNQQSGQTVTYTGLQPGTAYNFAMTLDGPGAMPNCVYTESITMPTLPSLQFTVSSTTVCVGEVITLTIPAANYLPNHIYTWIFNGTSYVANNPSTDITFNTVNSLNPSVKLEVTTPNGCHYQSNAVPITVNQANLNFQILSSNLNVCENSSTPPQIFVSVPFGAVSNYQWMNGNQPVSAPSSPSFFPTQSGSYWVILKDGLTGCLDRSTASNPVVVTLKKAPYVNISAMSASCAGQAVTLTGIVTETGLEYQWKLNNSVIPGQAWGIAGSTYTTGALAAGTYTYTLEARPAGVANGCVGTKSFTVTVSNPPSVPVITYTKQNCQPYEVLLTASGPSSGQYNWSNGMTGQSITVNEGGAYEVIYTAPSGCKVSTQVQVPLSLESLMWVFPTGCYDECLREDRYIIGPKGIFDSHEWQLFGSNVQSGVNDYIYPLFLYNAGTYQLQISHFGCVYTSGAMNLFPDPKECGIEPDCKLEAHIEGMKWQWDHYSVSGVIVNSGSQPMTITISSLNGYGTYIPSIITIPAGGTYDMYANPVLFYANGTFPGGADEILFDAGNGCKVIGKVEVPVFESKIAATKLAASGSSLTMLPNPAKERVKISYTTGDENLKATQLTVFDAMGNTKFNKELKTASGDVDVEVSSWLQGMYIVIVHTEGKPLQGKLIKN
ncbi:PKD domain-containing protein [Chryseobacterium taiwanense]|nr:PKD domain-containing protein [Chryseobacterium taiwanense]